MDTKTSNNRLEDYPVYDRGQPSAFEKVLWKCAGADAELLKQCPRSERVKYAGIGGIVLATAVLAFLSGGYAAYTVIISGSGNLNPEVEPTTVALAVMIGAFWSLVIFNLERFIVSSTGDGDGQSSIGIEFQFWKASFWKSELVQATPRLLMALLTGICLAAPLELRILKPEIDAVLMERQAEYLEQRNGASEEKFGIDLDRVTALRDAELEKITTIEAELENRRVEILNKRTALEDEIAGRVGSGRAGEGPAARAQRDNLDALQRELDRDRERRGSEIEALKAKVEGYNQELEELRGRLDAEKARNEKLAASYDGLSVRIQIAEEEAPTIVWFLRALLVFVEVAPILFKLQLARGPYVYMKKNEERLAAALHGIDSEGRTRLFSEGDTGLFVDSSKVSEEVEPVYYHPAAVLREQLRRHTTEHELANHVHERYRQQTRDRIDANPDAYIQSSSDDGDQA